MAPPELAQQCARAVMETVPRVMRAIREEARRHGAPLLTIPQLRTLGFLDRQPGACLARLAEYLGVSLPTASTLVERLVRQSLMTRTQDLRERRRVVLVLTPLGARHLRRARQSAHARIAATLAHLPPETLRRISRGVTMLGDAFQVPDGDSASPGAVPPAPSNGDDAKAAPAGTSGRSRRPEEAQRSRQIGRTGGRI